MMLSCSSSSWPRCGAVPVFERFPWLFLEYFWPCFLPGWKSLARSQEEEEGWGEFLWFHVIPLTLRGAGDTSSAGSHRRRLLKSLNDTLMQTGQRGRGFKPPWDPAESSVSVLKVPDMWVAGMEPRVFIHLKKLKLSMKNSNFKL